MGVVNETVQDGVGIGRIADYLVPSVYWKLGGNHRGAASVAFLEDFQKIMPGGGVERLQAPIIEKKRVSYQPRTCGVSGILEMMQPDKDQAAN